MFCFACVAAGCGRLNFDSEGVKGATDAGDAAVDGRQWQVVFDDTFDDGEIGTNVTGVGGGSHAARLGDTNFNGEVYFNTTGSLNVQIGWSLESGNVIASGR